MDIPRRTTFGRDTSLVFEDNNVIVVKSISDNLEVLIPQVFNVHVIDLSPELGVWAIEGANFESLDCHFC
jgi:hypothetical protein